MSLKVCDNCGKQFDRDNRHRSRNKHYFCCKEFAYEFKIKKQFVKCDWCGKPIYKKRSDIERSTHNFCNRGCYLDFVNFEKAGAYNQIVAGKCLYRSLVEIRIGRTLSSDEQVHHIDGNHRNHRPENLVVVTRSEHSKIHAPMKERDKLGRFIKKKSNA